MKVLTYNVKWRCFDISICHSNALKCQTQCPLPISLLEGRRAAEWFDHYRWNLKGVYSCWNQPHAWSVWLCCSTCFSANFNFFFLLKLSAVCTFWIVLMCWYQKWFLKNKKTSLVCISARKAIWKATTTTLPNTLLNG